MSATNDTQEPRLFATETERADWLRDRCAALTEALERYGHHDSLCAAFQDPSGPSGECSCGFREALAAAPTRDATGYVEVRSTACHAGMDGECSWTDCPQLRDGEPARSGRHCPLDQAAAAPTREEEPPLDAEGKPEDGRDPPTYDDVQNALRDYWHEADQRQARGEAAPSRGVTRLDTPYTRAINAVESLTDQQRTQLAAALDRELALLRGEEPR